MTEIGKWTVAADVAILRGVVGREMHAQAAAALDRIEARGEPIEPKPSRVWMHRCGYIAVGDDSPESCERCAAPPRVWDRLYFL